MEVELAQLPLTLESFSATTTSPTSYVHLLLLLVLGLQSGRKEATIEVREGTTKVVRKEHS